MFQYISNLLIFFSGRPVSWGPLACYSWLDWFISRPPSCKVYTVWIPISSSSSDCTEKECVAGCLFEPVCLPWCLAKGYKHNLELEVTFPFCQDSYREVNPSAGALETSVSVLLSALSPCAREFVSINFFVSSNILNFRVFCFVL